MEERSQGAIEYLLMLSAALVVVAGIVYTIYGTSSGLGTDISTKIENVRDTVIDILT